MVKISSAWILALLPVALAAVAAPSYHDDALALRDLDVVSVDPVLLRRMLVEATLERRSGGEDKKAQRLQDEHAKHSFYSDMSAHTSKFIDEQKKKGMHVDAAEKTHVDKAADWHAQQAKAAGNRFKVHEKEKSGSSSGDVQMGGVKRPHPGARKRSLVLLPVALARRAGQSDKDKDWRKVQEEHEYYHKLHVDTSKFINEQKKKGIPVDLREQRHVDKQAVQHKIDAINAKGKIKKPHPGESSGSNV